MYNLRALIKYEYKKLLQRKAVWIVTLTLMAMAAASVILPPFMTVISSNNDNGIPYYTGTAAQLYDLRKDYLQARWAQESLSDEEKAFLTAQEEDITTPFIYRYCGSYKSILPPLQSSLSWFPSLLRCASLLYPQRNTPERLTRSFCAHGLADTRLSLQNCLLPLYFL